MKPKFGLRLPVTGPLASTSSIHKIGTLADELGFDAITTHDHVSLNFEGRYHHSGGMSEAVDEKARQNMSVTDIFESMTTLSVLAGETGRVSLIPCATVLPWRHPVLFAKQAMTLHELSGGRFVCPVVIGNIRSDFRAMGVDYKKRGKIMDEYLEVLKLIFTGAGKINYQGKFVTISEADFQPRPSKKIPIWIGGSFTEKAFDRVARFGDGFFPDGSPEVYRANLPRLMEYLRQRGRLLDEIVVGTQVFMSLAEDSRAAITQSAHTLESFFEGSEWDKADINFPTKTRREVGVEGALSNNFIGSPDAVIKKIEEWTTAGVTFFDIRQISRTIDEACSMVKLFASEVKSSF